jgi:hypothetical protein
VDIGEGLACRPVSDTSNLGVIQDATFVVALVSKDDDFRYSDEELFSRDSSASTAEVVENVVDIKKMLPDELTNAEIGQ